MHICVCYARWSQPINDGSAETLPYATWRPHGPCQDPLTSHAFARPESGAAAGLGALTGVSTGLEVSFRDLPRLTAGGS